MTIVLIVHDSTNCIVVDVSSTFVSDRISRLGSVQPWINQFRIWDVNRQLEALDFLVGGMKDSQVSVFEKFLLYTFPCFTV